MNSPSAEPSAAPQRGGLRAVPGRVRDWFGRRRNRLAALALLAVGLFVAGAVTAQLVLPQTVAAGPTVLASPEPSDQASNSATMPDIEGLELTIARRVLRSARISAELSTTERSAAGAPGVVLSQQPEPGTPVTGTVSVEISAPAPMPALIGANLDEARDRVEALGAAVLLERRVAPSRPDGTVLEMTPAAGEPMPNVVTLVVADTGEGLPLANLSAVDSSSCSSTDSAMLNGTSVQASITCSPTPSGSGWNSGPATMEWAIGRRAPVLEFLAGAEDTAGRGGGVIRVIGDGRELKTVRVKFGSARKIRVDTPQVLRLRIEVTTTSKAQPEIVLGDARLLGTRKDLEILLGSQ